MKPGKSMMDLLIAGSGTSIMRAAAKQILESMEPHEAVEGEEARIATAITEEAKNGGMESGLISLLLLHSVALSYIEAKLGGMPSRSQMPSVGNC